MALVHNPIATDAATLITLQGGNPASGTLGAIGYTTDPVNPDPPEYRIHITETGSGGNTRYFAKLQIMRAPHEGTNASHYLQAGVYETNFSFSAEDFTFRQYPIAPNRYAISGCLVPYRHNVHGAGRPTRVYFVMPVAMANLNRDAEIEHCNDHLYAYQQTLGVLQTALTAVQGTQFGPFPTQLAARQAVIAAFLNLVPVARQGLGGNVQNWLQEYLRLCSKSGDRDGNDYHTFGLHPINPAMVVIGPITYLTGAARDQDNHQKVFLKITQGQTDINNHASATLIV